MSAFRSWVRPGAVGVVAAGGLLVVLAGPAAAHVDPDPTSVTAGATATVSFGVEHGCDGSDTTWMTFSIPDGVTGAKGVDKAGWKIENTAKTVTFSGGPLDAKTADHFELTFTAPAAATTLYFPVVQGCAKGQLDWITIAAKGEEEPTHPAPMVEVTGAAATAATAATATTAAAHDHAEETATSDHDHAEGGDSSSTTSTVAPASDDDSGSGGTGKAVLYGGLGVFGVALVAAGVRMSGRKK